MDLLWCYWIAFGLILVGAELFVPSFTIIWFGLGACMVGFWLLVVPRTPLALQLLIWAGVSALCTILWFRFFKPKMADRTTAGMSKEAILGEMRMIVKAITTPMEKGTIRFPIPILGAEE